MIDTNQKTVYFLGAGASNASDFHLPTMDKFFEGANLTGDKEHQNLKRFIDEKFPGRPIEKLNLEEMVTTIELSLDTFGVLGKHPEPYIYEARTELNKYVNARLQISKYKGCSLLGKIFDENIAGDTSIDSIITLNYDLVIDNCLFAGQRQPGPRYLLDRMYELIGVTLYLDTGESLSLSHEDANLGFYLKLHGSIDWLYCPNFDCGYHQQFFPNRIGNEPTHNRPGDLCGLCGSPIVSVIVPPTMYKTFEKFPKMGFLWSLAYRELNAADRIVIFGVSFAQSDYYLRWLFKKAITDRKTDGKNEPTIINIDPDDKVCCEIKRITGVIPKHFSKLDEYLSGASET
jgi:hypothetical protein